MILPTEKLLSENSIFSADIDSFTDSRIQCFNSCYSHAYTCTLVLVTAIGNVHNKQRKYSPATDFLKKKLIYIITKLYTMESLWR